MQCLDKFYSIAASTSFDSSASADATERGKAEKYVALDVPRLGRELAWLKTALPSEQNGHGQVLLDSFAASLGAAAAGGAAGGSLPSVAAPHTTIYPLKVPRATTAVAQAKIDATALAFRVVYAHNDLLSGNILHVETPRATSASTEEAEVAAGSGSSTGTGTSSGTDLLSTASTTTYLDDRVQIIDYEYGGYNYAAFDFANHFCEHAGFDFDLDRWYPSRPTQLRWLRAYFARSGVAIPNASFYAGSDGTSSKGAATPEEEDSITEAFWDELYVRVNQFSLASHCWWGLWAVVQARHSPIDFDFMSYSLDRFKGYDKHKAEFFPLVPVRA
jgi:thiamine kinase-like enzyme